MAIWAAASAGYLEVVRALVEAKCNVNQMKYDTDTPLAVAAAIGHVEIAKELLAAGADKTAQTKWGTALERAQEHVKDVEKKTALEELLSTFKAWEVQGSTELHRAACENRAEDVGPLVQAGCLLNAANASERTALHCAAQYGAVEALKALLEAGADPNAKDKEKKTALRLAIEGKKSEGKKSESVAALREGGALDLHLAALLDDAAMARACIEAGADLDLPDAAFGRTAAHYAAEEGAVEALT
eukprot:984014-Rhodomonas_salina.1